MAIRTRTVAGAPRRSPDPWRRSIDESLPADRDASRRLTRVDLAIVLLVVAAVLAMAIWFLFIATGGPGLGTV